MKILTVTNYYPPHFLGGYEIACKDTMEFLKKMGHEVVVITSQYNKNDEVEDGVSREMHLVNYKKVSRFEKKIQEYKNYKILLDAIKKVKPDLVYFWSLRGFGVGLIRAVEEQNIAKVFEIGDFWMYGYMQKQSISKRILSSFFHFLTIEI